jgi:Flp pilus assembly pilin Flp
MGARLKEGQGLVEYALIILLLVLVVIGALALFGDQLNTAFLSITDAIPIGE